MQKFDLREIVKENIQNELSAIGFDEGYSYIAAKKFQYKNIKIYGLTPAQANIIKQTALTVGADCATNREVITGKCELSDAILGGSISQLEKISDKLKFQPFSLKILGEKLLEFITKSKRETKLVGILNITPDSFSDGGKYFNPVDAQHHLIELIEDGADMIDIGAESTKPYSEPTSPEEQIKRLKPIFKFIQEEKITIPISVDTRSSEVADFVLNNGASIINDVSGLEYDKKMVQIISKYGAGVIIQHSKGTPQDMQLNPHYDNVIEEIYNSLYEKIEFAKSFGIKNIISDVGIGFGKTREHNFELINRITEFHGLNTPIMVGVSRKSFLGIEDNNNELKDALTLAVSYPLINKADYLRVHNIKLHKHLLNIQPAIN